MVARRAREAAELLCALAAVVVLGAGSLTALVTFHREAVDRGVSMVLAGAPAAERSVLLHAASPDVFAERDRAVRELSADPATARYGAGQQLRSARTLRFAATVALDDLPARATLVGGGWARPGATPPQVTVADRVARALRVGPGGRIGLTDRASGRSYEVVVAGVWRPRESADPYWLLLPGGDSPSLVLPARDLLTRFAAQASASWLLAPPLAASSAADVTATARELPRRARRAGFADSDVSTAMGELGARLDRATAAARTVLVSACALILVPQVVILALLAASLERGRWRQSALLRARGASRRRLARLAAAEAAVVVVPAGLLAPLATAWALAREVDASVWLVAAGAIVLGLAAMVAPALRTSASYIAEQASAARPGRRGAVQRAGVDLALVALTVVCAYEVSQSAGETPDALLAAGLALVILTGAALTLRAVPLIARLAERRSRRSTWGATLLGVWQAGRRPHTAPMLALAASVAVAGLTLATAATWERSRAAEADLRVGADLRLAPASAAQVGGLPGVRSAVPVWRGSAALGPYRTPAVLLAVDASAARSALRMDVGLGDVVGARRRTRSAVPGVFTSALLRELRLPVGASGSLPVAGVDVPIVVAREVPALPATDGQPRAALLDLPALANYLEHDGEPPLTPDEWWIATIPAGHAAAAEAARGLAGVTVLDRTGIADAARTDPYWTGARRDLLLVAAASMLLALVGMALDARVVARRRRGENAVLAALGASGGVLARAVIVERLLLTVVGVLVGVATGVVGAAILGGGMIRSSSGESPFPAPPLVVPGLELAVLTVGTLTAAVAVSRLLGGGASATPRGDA